MMEQLLWEIQRFRAWADALHAEMKPEEIPGEWATDYDSWRSIRKQFLEVITNSSPDAYTRSELKELVYIIARDNEDEALADYLCDEDTWFMRLCEISMEMPEWHAKWQLATRLDEAKDAVQACRLLERFIHDENEYVRRRSLLMLPKLMPEKVEQYAALFWNQDQYGELQEYQRMAILTVLFDIRSPLLPEYLNRAKEVGGTYLVQRAEHILSEM